MTRKRFVKLLMGTGMQRNKAQKIARLRPEASYEASFRSVSVVLSRVNAQLCSAFTVAIRAWARACERFRAEARTMAMDVLIAGDGEDHG